MIGTLREHGPELTGGGARLTAIREQLAEIRSCFDVVGPQGDRALEVRERFVRPPA